MAKLMKKSVSIDYQKPICAGEIYKQNKVGNFFNKRYFALYPHYLVYYGNESDYKKDLELNTLEHRHGAYNLEGVYLTHCQKKPDGAKYCFVMHLPAKCNSRHEVLLNCKSQVDRKFWMEKLQAQNAKLVSHEHEHGTHNDHRDTHQSENAHQSGGAHLSVPREYPRQMSHGGEGELNVQEGDSDEEHPTDCQA